jgi:3-hydroxyisobutyrate dehydrogenase
MPSTNTKTYEPSPSTRVAFLGLGVMGYPMAGHLALAGTSGHVYNRTATKSIAWCEEFARAEHPNGHQHPCRDTPSGGAAGRYRFCCVGNDDDLRSVTTGPDGAFAGMKPWCHFCGPHHGVRQCCAGTRCRSPPPGPALCRCTRFGRPGRRTERHAHGDVRG